MSELSTQFDGDAVLAETVINDTGTVVGPIEIQGYERFTIYVENVGGGSANDLDSLIVESAPTLAGPWLQEHNGFWDEIEYPEQLTLASGDSSYCSFCCKSVKYLRVTLACASGEDTTAKAWISVGGAE